MLWRRVQTSNSVRNSIRVGRGPSGRLMQDSDRQDSEPTVVFAWLVAAIMYDTVDYCTSLLTTGSINLV